MLKSAVSAVFLVAALAGSARADPIFDGGLVYTAASNCPNGPGVGATYTAQYHPVVVGGVTQSLNIAALNVYYTYGMFGYSRNGADFPVSATGVFTIPSPITPYAVGWSEYTPTLGGNLVVISRAPAAIATTTPAVSIKGKIQNPFFNSAEPNCVATFEFSGVLTQ